MDYHSKQTKQADSHIDVKLKWVSKVLFVRYLVHLHRKYFIDMSLLSLCSKVLQNWQKI